MGSAFTVWQAPCQHAKAPEKVTAFGSHSTGYKLKGDGNKFPPDNYNPNYSWGECPECKYWPTKVEKTDGLKACIFDNSGDPTSSDPLFYRSSVQLNKNWTALGMRAETHFGTGGHCAVHSVYNIAKCMDDGTGRLFTKNSAPSPSPSPGPPPPHPPGPAPHPPGPAPGPAPGPEPIPPQKCQDCFDKNCANEKTPRSTCIACVQQNGGTCAPDCQGFPFPAVQDWFCGKAQ